MVEGMVGSRLRCAGKSWIRRMFPLVSSTTTDVPSPGLLPSIVSADHSVSPSFTRPMPPENPETTRARWPIVRFIRWFSVG